MCMEIEIQNCEKCLEDMKALYQLNAERLSYNYKVLHDKKNENIYLQLDLKKKERFFINLYKIKMDEFNAKQKKYQRANKIMTQQFEHF